MTVCFYLQAVTLHIYLVKTFLGMEILFPLSLLQLEKKCYGKLAMVFFLLFITEENWINRAK